MNRSINTDNINELYKFLNILNPTEYIMSSQKKKKCLIVRLKILRMNDHDMFTTKSVPFTGQQTN